jgi:hypothetical protein
MRVPSILLISFAVSLTACSGKKPSEAECQAFTDHWLDLVEKANSPQKVKQLRNKHRDTILETCAKKGTLEEVECAMGVETLEELAEKCG